MTKGRRQGASKGDGKSDVKGVNMSRSQQDREAKSRKK